MNNMAQKSTDYKLALQNKHLQAIWPHGNKMFMTTELNKTKKQHKKTTMQLIKTFLFMTTELNKTEKQHEKTTMQLIKTFFGLHGQQWYSIQRWKSS